MSLWRATTWASFEARASPMISLLGLTSNWAVTGLVVVLVGWTRQLYQINRAPNKQTQVVRNNKNNIMFTTCICIYSLLFFVSHRASQPYKLQMYSRIYKRYALQHKLCPRFLIISTISTHTHTHNDNMQILHEKWARFFNFKFHDIPSYGNFTCVQLASCVCCQVTLLTSACKSQLH